ncbi:COP9 signalosome complex subunit 12 [Trypanosoma theileri]|uniref:COP9 signalosome complex subunit 12 n=1 Tax=Trypanosoma theileri TaxID=67003 RepID=A0A1X0NKD6_9TRYP|nr:COP9 signalosome complex subunit 12 [Trypanosoma theileri]ORC85224.1 COP9 signalosome complex subunit 12 [Trypanosoma theileri]
MRWESRKSEPHGVLRISTVWLQHTADAIATRNGVLLTDCVALAEDGGAAEVPTAEELTHIQTAVHQLHQALTERVEQTHSSRRESRSEHTEDVKERQLYVEVMVRVAITGVLANYHRMKSNINNDNNNSNSNGEENNKNSNDNNSKPSQRYADTLARGLLYAFEVFQEVHTMRRGHYPTHRRGGSTVGTVGWDTLLLLHFVHRIPRIARDASESVIDEATGQIVRSWRKLLQALQVADPHEPPEHSRRRGALAVCNGLLSILFHRYNTHQCRVLFNAVEQNERNVGTGNDGSKSILRPAQHMTAEMITFYYYKGRIMLYDRRFKEAHEALREAYHLLPPPGEGTEIQQRNKQRVRFYLTVAGIADGKVVPQEILQRDDLIDYVFTPMLNAAARGDPHAFTHAVETFSTLLRRRGVYFLLQRAKLYCFLVLLARTHIALGACTGVDNSRIPLSVLTAAYTHILQEGKSTEKEKTPLKQKTQKRQRGDDIIEDENVMTDDQMTWWTAKLIASGLVRGYISYEHKTIVLSRQAPFPTLAEQSRK